MHITIYIDDSELRAKLTDYAELCRACEIFQEFDTFSGQVCNGPKCKGFGSSAKGRRLVATLLPAGGLVALNPTSLGYLLVMSKHGARTLQDKRCDGQVVPLSRLARVPVPKADKLKVVMTYTIPSIQYGTLLVLPTYSVLMKLRTMILRACYSETQGLRERHMVILFGMQTHRADP